MLHPSPTNTEAIFHILHYLKDDPRRRLLYMSFTFFVWQIFLMLTRLVVILIGSPLLTIIALSKVILLCGTGKSKMLSLILLPKLNIKLWLILLPRCYGFALSFMTWILMLLLLSNSQWQPSYYHILHERHEHIKVDYHFIWDLLMWQQIATPYVLLDNYMGGILTKSLACASLQTPSFKLSTFDVYAPAWGGTLELPLLFLILAKRCSFGYIYR